MALLLDELPKRIRQELLQAPNTWVAELISTSPQAVQQWRKRHGLASVTGRGGKPRPGKVEWLVAYRRQLYREMGD